MMHASLDESRTRPRAPARSPRPTLAFTLVEILVVAVLLSLVGGVTFLLSSAGRGVWVRTDAKLASMTDAQRAVDRITEELRRGAQTPLPDCGAGTSLGFQLATGNMAGEQVSYQLAGTALTRSVNGAAATIVASGLADFRTRCQPGGLVRFSLTASTSSALGPATRVVESQVWVQNNP